MENLRVLIADDQIPSDVENNNDQVFQQLEQQLSEKFRQKGEDLKVAFSKDRQWFEALLKRLSINFDPVRARTVARDGAFAGLRSSCWSKTSGF